MLSVWTYWSKPARVGWHSVWQSERHHWLSWVLSVETTRSHYPETVLFTDEEGARLLVDALGLAFSRVSTGLSRFEDLDPSLWALPKIHSYRQQTEPFLHLDSDVFLWKRLPARLERADVIAQNPEEFMVGESHYRPDAFDPAGEGSGDLWVPAEWAWFYGGGRNPQRGDACGIFGGNRVEFVRYYAELAEKFVEHPANHRLLLRLAREFGASNACGLFEEYLLSACIEFHKAHAGSPYAGIGIEYLFSSMAEAFDQERAAGAGYTHLIGSAKCNTALCERLDQRVMRDHPEYYERCLRLEASHRGGSSGAVAVPERDRSPSSSPDSRDEGHADRLPGVLFVELTRHCNLACPMCRPERRSFKSETMSDAVFERVEQLLFPAARVVDLRGFGESLLLPSFPRRVQQVAERGLDVRVGSNLSLRAEPALDALAAVNARIAVSLDTADADLLRQVRRGARMERIIANVAFLRGAYERHGSDYGRVYFSVTVQRATIGRLTQLVEVAVDCGITDLRLFARVDRGELFATEIPERRALIDDLERCRRIAARYGIRIRIGTKLWPGMKDELPPYDFPCLRPWTYCVVAWDGALGFCDFLIGPGGGHGLGNIMDPDFEQAWNGASWRELRRRHRSGELGGGAISAHCAWCYRNRYVDFEDDFDVRYLPRILTPEGLLRANPRGTV